MPGSKETVALRFPNGVDQVSAETELPAGSARRIVNYDVHKGGVTRSGAAYGGRLARRSEVKLALAGLRTHSLWSCEYGTLYVSVGDLRLISADMTSSVLRAGVGESEMFYTEVNGVIYYSNGIVTGTVANGVSGTWGMPVPAGPTTMTMATGGLSAGTYMVALTYKNGAGRESGASPTAFVQVVEGGGISISGIINEGYVVRVYASPANGEALYWVQDTTAAVTYIGAHQPGKLLATQHLVRPEPCTLLDEYNGRIYGAIGNALVATQAMNYDLTRPSTEYVLFADALTMNKSVDDGIYIGNQHGVTFLEGADIKEFKQRTADALPPIPGSAMKVDGALFESESDGVIWLTRRGWVFGGPGGQIKRLSESQMALPQYDRAATLYREQDGLRQVLTFVGGGGGEGAGASDSYDVEIVRNGRVI